MSSGNFSMKPIDLTLVVEANGRTTEVLAPEIQNQPYAPIIQTAKNIADKMGRAIDDRKCYQERDYLFSVMVSNGVLYLCAARTGFRQRVAFQYLNTIQREYEDYEYDQQPKTNELKQFIEREMHRFSNDPSIDKIQTVQQKTDQVKEVAVELVDKLLKRGEDLDHVNDVAERLQDDGNRFHQVSRRQKWMERRKNWIYTAVLILCLLIFLGLIAGIIAWIVEANN